MTCECPIGVEEIEAMIIVAVSAAFGDREGTEMVWDYRAAVERDAAWKIRDDTEYPSYSDGGPVMQHAANLIDPDVENHNEHS